MARVIYKTLWNIYKQGGCQAIGLGIQADVDLWTSALHEYAFGEKQDSSTGPDCLALFKAENRNVWPTKRLHWAQAMSKYMSKNAWQVSIYMSENACSVYYMSEITWSKSKYMSKNTWATSKCMSDNPWAILNRCQIIHEQCKKINPYTSYIYQYQALLVMSRTWL